ncbi:translation initiation factor IF-2 [Candidatus Campbellbacteria bacterium RIFOXYC2_FULL_35_25]|uniref:Translation initiation factor IF-2 n=1 Tax=Candidatus Campbellbacteria bacterium RIFOXYC2_FULL_35_25 TaxID=1797582 RepID=A0A1F5EH32_9BACT|nr:MAG: translation initiation factor IF-2 [Candidatus Campbellbacteria bacterium RIFOXYC2_FULL_35_25]
MDKNAEKNNTVERPPVIAIMGHIDHGKSALLDYIRKSNIVEGEAGGITQHISAYEVVHKTKDGKNKKITFLDTPGHAAFTAMRLRGANIADIAILIISAEEGPKPQTLEALKSIKEAGIPFIVAINKIDRPGANVEKVKQNLIENEIYLEGYGGDIPYNPISAKTGEGVSELLDNVLLMAEMEELRSDESKLAEGIVLEANHDSKKGVCVTLVVKDGTLKTGSFIVCEDKYAPVRTMNNFLGEPIKEASFSSPIKVTGFKEIPTVGSPFYSFSSKKDAEKKALEYIASKEIKENKGTKEQGATETDFTGEKAIIPIIIKVDVLGTLEAIQHEIEKIKNERVTVKIIKAGVGNVTENDIQTAGGDPNTIVVGFNVKIDREAKDSSEKMKIQTNTFNIIYKLTEWLEEKIKEKTPKVKTNKVIGKAKIIRIFSQTKDKQVIGGKILEGTISVGAKVKISRREHEIGEGKVLGLQSQKIETKEVREGEEFGSVVESKKEIAPGDILEAFIVVEE